jgi:threonyl-tRNA synthetase
MKILLIHADKFKYQTTGKAIKQPEEVEEDRQTYSTVGEVLVAFCAVEKQDEKNPQEVEEKTACSIEEAAEAVKVKSLVIYPYAHLSSELASPKTAVTILQEISNLLQGRGYEVKRAPFGWYKSFEISCKGHPLSELSRTITSEGEEVKKPSIQLTYKILTQEMKLYNPEDYTFKSGEEEFKALVEKEALKKGLIGGAEPRYITYCKKFGIGWEGFSDLGHMRYGPEANLIFELVADYAGMLVDSLDIPVYRVRGTNMFDLSVPAVKEHAELFGDRLYELGTEGRRLVLRYAACHQQFAMIKDWIISYKDLPMGAYELADSYRLEQEGELLLCFRTRKLHMPDLHVFCRDLTEAENFSLNIHKKIYSEIGKLGRDYVSLYNTTESYFKSHQEFFNQLLKVEKKPVLLCFVPERYYWVLNIEYNIIDDLNRPREIATFQIDVGNSKRFNINYVDANGEKVHPIIIHTALIGTIERYLFTVFDSIVKEEKAGIRPMLPLWLSPTQVRVIPISRDQMEFASKIADKLEGGEVRVDLDDRDETLSKKVRSAETRWIPYIAVVGEEEAKTGKITLRTRGSKEQRQLEAEELIKEIKSKIKGYPWKPLSIPRMVSRRPLY